MAKTTTLSAIKAYAIRINNDQLSGKATAFVLEAIQDALKALGRLPWTFLVRRTRVVTQPQRTTPGTIGVDNGTRRVRFTSLVNPSGQPTLDGTWGVKFAGENIDYDFHSTASTTSIINLTSSYVGTGNLSIVAGIGSSFTVFKRSYDLPSDFRELLAIVDVRSPSFKLHRATYQSMLTMNLQRSSGDQPHTYSVESKNNDTGNMMARQLWLYPSPSGTTRFQYDLVYQRFVDVPTASTADTVVVDWPDEMIDILHAAIDVQLAKKANDQMMLAAARDEFDRMVKEAMGSDVDDSYSLYIGEDKRVARMETPFDITVTEGG